MSLLPFRLYIVVVVVADVLIAAAFPIVHSVLDRAVITVAVAAVLLWCVAVALLL